MGFSALSLVFAATLAAGGMTSDDIYDPTRIGDVVMITGIVRDAERAADDSLVLIVKRNAAEFTAIVPAKAKLKGRDLLDAEVNLAGVLDVKANGGGPLVRVASRDEVTILKPAPSHPFKLETADFSRLREDESPLPQHRVRVRGDVIAAWESRGLCRYFMKLDGDRTILVEAARKDQLPVRGDRVDAAGFVANVWDTPRLERAIVKILKHNESRLPKVMPLDAAQILDLAVNAGEDGVEEIFGEEVAVSGRVIEASRRELVVKDGGAAIAVEVAGGADATGIEIGSLARVTGCVMFEQGGTNPRVVAIRPGAIELIARPPFWTPNRLVALIGGIVAFALAVAAFLVWAVRRHERTRAEATERERMRLSSDLHDGLQQLLASARFRLDAAENLFDDEPADCRRQIHAAAKALLASQAGLRTILWGLQQESEGPNSLVGLFRYAASRLGHWQGVVEIRQEGEEPEWARKKGGELLLIMQEAVGNALHHGEATRIAAVIAFPRKGGLKLRISDNGCGFTAGADSPGLGLTTMRQRAAAIGGELKIISTEGVGTTVIVEVKG